MSELYLVRHGQTEWSRSGRHTSVTDLDLTETGIAQATSLRERLDPGKSAEAIKDKKLDAFFWVGGIPTAAVTDLAATPGVKLKLVDHSDLAEKMNAKYGKLYSPGKIKAGAYPGLDKDNAITEVWNLIVTGDKMSNEDAYAIVKTLVEKKADIVAVHKEAESFSLDNQVQTRSPIPFHPGALKYFKEKGIGG